MIASSQIIRNWTETVARSIWRRLFDRPVHEQTSVEIWQHAELVVTKHQDWDALKTLPPTWDEVAPIAYGLYEADIANEDHTPNPSTYYWDEGVRVVWEKRRSQR